MPNLHRSEILITSDKVSHLDTSWLQEVISTSLDKQLTLRLGQLDPLPSLKFIVVFDESANWWSTNSRAEWVMKALRLPTLEPFKGSIDLTHQFASELRRNQS